MLARLPRTLAVLVMFAFAATIAWFVLEPSAPVKLATHKGQYTDMMLYHDVVKQMVAGKPYHLAAAELHRAHHYPLRPFFAMRPPALAEAAHLVGWAGLQIVAYALAFAAIFLWGIGTEGALHWAERIGVGALVAVGFGAVSNPALMAMHELWSAMFLALAMAVMLWWRERWWLALPAVALALAVRELALPFLLLALAFALVERRWKEAAGWIAVAALFALYMTLHGRAAMAVIRPDDLASPGWDGMLGIKAFAKGVQFTSVLQELPAKLGMSLAILPMLGWAALDGRRGLFALLLFAGYALMVSLFARPDNFYWSMVVTPFYLAGAALLPRAAGQLWRAIRQAA